MEAWLIGGGALGFAVACGALAGRWKHSRTLAAAATFLCLAVMLFGLLVTTWPDFRRLFGVSFQFQSGMGLRFGLLAAGELAGGWILCEGVRQKRRFYLLVAPVFILGVAFAHYRNSAHDYSALNTSTDSRRVTLQSTGYTCTAASLSNLTALFGHKISERQAAEMMRLDNFGGTVWQLGYALRKLGYQFTEIDGQKITQVKFPAILIIKLGASVDHAILVTAHEGAQYDVVDPLIGGIARDGDWFAENWRGEGVMNIHPK